MAEVVKRKSPIEDYFGVPVLVQLKNFPLIGIQVRFRNKMPHASDPDAPAWIPEPLMHLVKVGGEVQESPSGTQLIQFAVLRDVGSQTLVEMQWFSNPPDPRNPNDQNKKALVATLIKLEDILSITRVVSVEEASPILLASS